MNGANIVVKFHLKLARNDYGVDLPDGTDVVFWIYASIERLSLNALLIALTSNPYVVLGCSPTAVNILSLSPVPLTIAVVFISFILSDTVAIV